MPDDKFADEPDPLDPLQVIGDVALMAIRAEFADRGVDVDSFSVVISLERDDRMATAIHAPNLGEEDDLGMAAFEMQMLHVLASARALGLQLRVFPIGHG